MKIYRSIADLDAADFAGELEHDDVRWMAGAFCSPLPPRAMILAENGLYQLHPIDALVYFVARGTNWTSLLNAEGELELGTEGEAIVRELLSLSGPTSRARKGHKYTFCIRDGCGDSDLGDLNQRTGLCGMCERAELG